MRKLFNLLILLVVAACSKSKPDAETSNPVIETLQFAQVYEGKTVQEVLEENYAVADIECSYWLDEVPTAGNPIDPDRSGALSLLTDYDFETNKTETTIWRVESTTYKTRDFDFKIHFFDLGITPVSVVDIETGDEIIEPRINIYIRACGDEVKVGTNGEYQTFGRCELPIEINKKRAHNFLEQNKIFNGGLGNISNGTRVFTVPYLYRCEFKTTLK